jgi:acyl-CoA synthetase (AMP-forming)/AMP-acid ligase II
MIIRGGMNISTREVEELVARHSGVRSVAIVGLPDAVPGERACAFVVPVNADDPPTLACITQFLLDEFELARQKLPERIEIVAALPMTPTGKIQKFLLRDSVGG